MTNKEKFIEICSCIKRDGINDLLEWLDKSDFYIAPASTKFHGNYVGGLLAHSLNVYRALKDLIQLHKLNVPEETIAIVALLHDTCKVNFYKQSYRNVKDETGHWIEKLVYEIDEKFPCGDHADKSIIIIQQYMKLTPEEILAIRSHMGGFDSSVKGGSYFIGKIFEKSPLAILLHLADMTATYLYEGQQDAN